MKVSLLHLFVCGMGWGAGLAWCGVLMYGQAPAGARHERHTAGCRWGAGAPPPQRYAVVHTAWVLAVVRPGHVRALNNTPPPTFPACLNSLM